MKAELKQQWLEALRSGKYKQGQTFLRCGDQYCCLGVLCDLLPQTKWAAIRLTNGKKPVYEPGQWNAAGFTTIGMECVIHYREQEKLGLREVRHAQLIQMNDAGKTFPEIADWIEQNVEVNDGSLANE